MKKKFRMNSIWAKIRKKGNLTDILYGLTDGTNNHGHTVISKIGPIYQRAVSGATLIISGTDLILNDNLLDSINIIASI